MKFHTTENDKIRITVKQTKNNTYTKMMSS